MNDTTASLREDLITQELNNLVKYHGKSFCIRAIEAYSKQRERAEIQRNRQKTKKIEDELEMLRLRKEIARLNALDQQKNNTPKTPQELINNIDKTTTKFEKLTIEDIENDGTLTDEEYNELINQ